jgi:hypothetical protein
MGAAMIILSSPLKPPAFIVGRRALPADLSVRIPCFFTQQSRLKKKATDLADGVSLIPTVSKYAVPRL